MKPYVTRYLQRFITELENCASADSSDLHLIGTLTEARRLKQHLEADSLTVEHLAGFKSAFRKFRACDMFGDKSPSLYKSANQLESVLTLWSPSEHWALS